VIAGAAVGVVLLAGAALILRGLRPAELSLARQLDQLTHSGSPASDDGPVGWRAELAARLPGDAQQRRTDLAITGGDLAVHVRDMAFLAAAAGLLGSVLASVRLGAGPVASVLIGLSVGAVGGWANDRTLADRATARRLEMDASLVLFTEMVALFASGGAGVNSALAAGAAVGDNWAFALIRAELDSAGLAGEHPWTALERLGTDLGVDRLTELGGALGLASTSGTAMGDTLTARAESSRRSALSDELERAERRSSRLGLPVGLMTFAWVAFIGYPAVQNLVVSP